MYGKPWLTSSTSFETKTGVITKLSPWGLYQLAFLALMVLAAGNERLETISSSRALQLLVLAPSSALSSTIVSVLGELVCTYSTSSYWNYLLLEVERIYKLRAEHKR
ncbi:hypothetical protein K492DRAFT_199418 [Lichtheimia hyalospora FSU 10163]|nr:hypothetical protein K492DRAFT_199418 [Lichtheimia hyalospora FSU 10163]